MGKLEILQEKLGRGKVKEDEPLSLHTTFKIGGPAQFYFEAEKTEELFEAVNLCRNLGLPFFILGGGSNVLVSDIGFKGLVIKNKSREIKILKYKGEVKEQKLKVKNVLIEADSGVSLNQLVRYTLEEGFSGLELFLGLPGTVGGAIFSNAHFGQKQMRDFLLGIKLLTPEGEMKEEKKDHFSSQEILLSAIFSLEKERKEILWQKASEALKYRRQTQPLEFPSAGCIFKNIFTPLTPLSVGFLIEQCGLKGKEIGGAKISEKHANFIVNKGGARAEDVVKLINICKRKVKEKFGLKLTEEIIYVGEFKG